MQLKKTHRIRIIFLLIAAVFSISIAAQNQKEEVAVKKVLETFFEALHKGDKFPIAENVLNRNFTSLQIGEKWVSDITYIKVSGHWNYITTIVDLADKKIVAWGLSDNIFFYCKTQFLEIKIPFFVLL